MAAAHATAQRAAAAAPLGAALEEELQAARTRYLEQEYLLSELHGMLQEAQHTAMEQDLHSSAGEHHQHQRYAGLPADAAAALAQHLQAATLIQHLQLPPCPDEAQHGRGAGARKAAAAAAAADTAPAGDQQLGSTQHVLGVTPQQLRQQFLPSRKAAHKAAAPLLPCLEQRLRQRAQAAVAAVTGVPADQQGPGAAADALDAVAAKQAGLRRLRRETAALLQQLVAEALGWLQELDSLHGVLAQLLGGCVLQEQPRIDEATRKHQQANLQQLISKLRVMQLSVRADAYDAKNLAALVAIRDELQASEAQLHADIKQVGSELGAYAELGPEFQALVAEYGDVTGKSWELDRMLEKLASIETEAAALFS